MKRFFSILLTLLLLISLTGCTGSTGSATEATAPIASGEEQPDPHGAAAPHLVFAGNNNRLYSLSAADHTLTRLSDELTSGSFDRDGDRLIAAFQDGSIRQLWISSGEETRLLEDTGHVSRIEYWDGGFVYTGYDMLSGIHVCRYNDADGTAKDILNGWYVSDPRTLGSTLVYLSYEDSPALVGYDLRESRESWRLELDTYRELYKQDGELYLFDSSSGTCLRLEQDTLTLVSADVGLEPGDFSLQYIAENGCLVDGGYDHDFDFFFVSGGTRQRLDIEQDQWGFLRTLAAGDEKVLLRYSDYRTCEELEDYDYNYTRYYLFDCTDGTLQELSLPDEEQQLFSAGDFPVMDTSTARKPVTRDVYSYFCLETGFGGALPLCSTTHYAWLNLADGGADIALLAAPTEEEAAYLEERGVQIEMKFYGGDGLVFIGSRACGVSDLSLADARAIFRGEITNWAELGGADHPIHVLYRDDQSGSQRLFERLLWDGEDIPDFAALGFQRLDEMSTLVWACLDDPYAIGYSIMTYLRDVYSEEDLLVFSLEQTAAIPENIRNGSYPLSTQGYVVIRRDEPEDSPARRLYNWFGSPVSAAILTANGVTPP